MHPDHVVWFVMISCLVILVSSENVCPEGEQLCLEGCVSKDHKCKMQTCPYPKIECKDRRKCYNKEQQCDKFYDCLDRSDELGCGRTTPSPYYYNPNQTVDTGPEKKKHLLTTWPGILLITVVVVIATVLIAIFCIYWSLKCRLLHDQIAYDEKHKFMEEHGEMPSAGPIISGIKPPQDGWKYVTKSAYMMMGENEAKALAADGPDAQLMNNVKDIPKVITTDPITETDEREEDELEEVSPGSPDPPAYDDAVQFPSKAEDVHDAIKEESGEEEEEAAMEATSDASIA